MIARNYIHQKMPNSSWHAFSFYHHTFKLQHFPIRFCRKILIRVSFLLSILFYFVRDMKFKYCSWYEWVVFRNFACSVLNLFFLTLTMLIVSRIYDKCPNYLHSIEKILFYCFSKLYLLRILLVNKTWYIHKHGIYITVDLFIISAYDYW